MNFGGSSNSFSSSAHLTVSSRGSSGQGGSGSLGGYSSGVQSGYGGSGTLGGYNGLGSPNSFGGGGQGGYRSSTQGGNTQSDILQTITDPDRSTLGDGLAGIGYDGYSSSLGSSSSQYGLGSGTGGEYGYGGYGGLSSGRGGYGISGYSGSDSSYQVNSYLPSNIYGSTIDSSSNYAGSYTEFDPSSHLIRPPIPSHTTYEPQQYPGQLRGYGPYNTTDLGSPGGYTSYQNSSIYSSTGPYDGYNKSSTVSSSSQSSNTYDILQYSWNSAIKELLYTVNSQNTEGPLLTLTDAAKLLHQGWQDAIQQGRTPQQKYEQAISYALSQIGY